MHTKIVVYLYTIHNTLEVVTKKEQSIDIQQQGWIFILSETSWTNRAHAVGSY